MAIGTAGVHEVFPIRTGVQVPRRHPLQAQGRRSPAARHDTRGLGKHVPFATGNQSESTIGLKDGKMVNRVVPYPMGFYAKTIDGRIDDPNAGSKAAASGASTDNRTPFHVEGGKGNTPKLVKFQLCPDPLAK